MPLLIALGGPNVNGGGEGESIRLFAFSGVTYAEYVDLRCVWNEIY